jgi:hypothetical protein
LADNLRISLVIGADGKAAIEGISKVGSSLESMKKQAADSGGVLSSISSRMASSLRQLSAAALAAVGIYKLTSAATDLVKESTLLAARSETLGVVMSQVGVNAGYSSDQMRGYMEAVRSAGITTIQSQEAVIRMTQAHLDLAQASKLARVAQDAAVIGAVNSSEALDRLLHGITTLQPEILRTIGITVNFEQEYARAAAQMGKNQEALSQQEKQQIAFNAVLSRGADIAGSYEAAMGTAGKQMGSLSRLFEEAKLQIGQAFNPAFTILIRAVSNEVESLSNWLVRMQDEGKIARWSASFSSAVRSAWNGARTLGETLAWTAGKISAFWEVGQAVAAGMGALWVVKWAAASTAVSNFLFYAKNAGFMVEYLSAAVLPGLVSPAGIAAAAVGLLAYAFISVGKEARDAERDVEAFKVRAAGMNMDEATANLQGFTDQLRETRRVLQQFDGAPLPGDLGVDFGLISASAQATALEGKIKAAEDRIAQVRKMREVEDQQIAAARAKAEQDRKSQVNAQLESQLAEGTRKAGVSASADRMAQIDAEAAHYLEQGAKKATVDRWAAAQKVKAAQDAHDKVMEFVSSESQSDVEQLEQKIRDYEREGASFEDLVRAWEAGYDRIERKRGADAAKANEEWERKMTEQAAAEGLARANVELQAAENVARRKQEINQLALAAGNIAESQVLRERYAGERNVLKAKEDQIFASLVVAKTEEEYIRLAGEYKALKEEIVFLEEREAYELGARRLQLQTEITDLSRQQAEMLQQQNRSHAQEALGKIGGGELGSSLGEFSTLAQGVEAGVAQGNDQYSLEYQAWAAFQDQKVMKLEEQYALEQERLRLNGTSEILIMEATQARASEIRDAYREYDQQAEQATQQQKIAMAGAGFGMMANLASAFYAASGNQSKKAFAVMKAMRIGETVMNTYSAAVAAYNAMASIPYVGPALGAAAAAAAIAFGMAQVKAIASSQPGGSGAVASVGGGVPSYAGSSATPALSALPAQTEEKRPLVINITVQGGLYGDADAIARSLVPYLNKATGDGVN